MRSHLRIMTTWLCFLHVWENELIAGVVSDGTQKKRVGRTTDQMQLKLSSRVGTIAVI